MTRFAEMIEQCRDNFRAAQRTAEPEAQRRFKLQSSLFQRFLFFVTGDKLRIILRDQDILRDQGRVVWGFLVQANSILFEPTNRSMLPADVIYSPDVYFDGRVPEFQNVASNLFGLKGTSPGDRELEQFANIITDELTRAMRLPLPRSLCDGRNGYFSTFLIQPSHLPASYLAAGYFPLVICPEKTDAVMILPAEYWPAELKNSWGT